MTQTPRTKILSQQFNSKSKWTPPEGQFTSLDYFIKKCRHNIKKLKSNRNTKFSNFSSEEWSAIKIQKKKKKKRKKNAKTIIKAADKGGAVLVGGPTSSRRKLCGNFLKSSFMQKLTKISLSSTETWSKIRFSIL